ncbi:hypothetical protein E2C01_048182 [Portunus trituberculatus]|uniref:Uncharacterized protein n=1 Tax=Portunus trituberculatus TaxID=210409 RepID=A0A5B7G5Q7_PORTR|nr:hypothetical protein [Portunus trituberculatus]
MEINGHSSRTGRVWDEARNPGFCQGPDELLGGFVTRDESCVYCPVTAVSLTMLAVLRPSHLTRFVSLVHLVAASIIHGEVETERQADRQ